MISQLDFVKETGLPRYGCFWMCLAVAPFLYFHKPPDYETVMRIYVDSRQTKFWKKPVLDLIVAEDYRLVTNFPDKVLMSAMSYVSLDHDVAQFRDTEFTLPDRPSEYEGLTYSLIAFERPTGVHWVLGDKQGRNIIYNPDESLDINPWKRALFWRGIQIFRKDAYELANRRGTPA